MRAPQLEAAAPSPSTTELGDAGTHVCSHKAKAPNAQKPFANAPALITLELEDAGADFSSVETQASCAAQSSVNAPGFEAQVPKCFSAFHQCIVYNRA